MPDSRPVPAGLIPPGDPDDPTVLALELEGDFDGALARLDALIATDPTRLERHVHAARLEYAAGRLDRMSDRLLALNGVELTSTYWLAQWAQLLWKTGDPLG